MGFAVDTKMIKLFRTFAVLADVSCVQSNLGNTRSKYYSTLCNKQYNFSLRDGLFAQAKRQFKANRKPSRSADATFEGIAVESGPVPFKNLLKPLGFTIVFSAGSLAGATIWQYENMRTHAMSMVRKPTHWLQQSQKKMGAWRQELNKQWNSLGEGEKLYIPLFIMNAIVFAVWRVPRFQPFMVKYFCSNPAAKVLCWPMILSTFSHYSTFHLLANMFVLYTFSTGVVQNMGKEQFLGMYLAGGVISSFASYLHKAITCQASLSLGASGAIMSVLGYVCSEYPETRLSIIFLPMFTFSASIALKVIIGIDVAGVVLGWKFFDHAAHLGGALWGMSWCYWGNTYIWQKREPLLQYWHSLRGGTSR
ncbi:rhomboid family intramembrane serine protease rho-7 [Arctopsyche grandis]|uniref:rhomboid family intramembrane serine protease rho-7 n=1 Tax=Arctopsyche grandis TaxID=121162 RepID=UPI00406D7355